MPWTTNISATLVISYQDYSGIWKGLIVRTLDDTCKIFFTPKGLLANQRKKYMPVCEEGCPSKPQFCTAGPAIVNRYRKDWEEDLKFWIPPYFMEADNWKAYGKAFYKDDPNNILAELTFEYRLLNERMSQQSVHFEFYGFMIILTYLKLLECFKLLNKEPFEAYKWDRDQMGFVLELYSHILQLEP